MRPGRVSSLYIHLLIASLVQPMGTTRRRIDRESPFARLSIFLLVAGRHDDREFHLRKESQNSSRAIIPSPAPLISALSLGYRLRGGKSRAKGVALTIRSIWTGRPRPNSPKSLFLERERERESSLPRETYVISLGIATAEFFVAVQLCRLTLVECPFARS